MSMLMNLYKNYVCVNFFKSLAIKIPFGSNSLAKS